MVSICQIRILWLITCILVFTSLRYAPNINTGYPTAINKKIFTVIQSFSKYYDLSHHGRKPLEKSFLKQFDKIQQLRLKQLRKLKEHQKIHSKQVKQSDLLQPTKTLSKQQQSHQQKKEGSELQKLPHQQGQREQLKVTLNQKKVVEKNPTEERNTSLQIKVYQELSQNTNSSEYQEHSTKSPTQKKSKATSIEQHQDPTKVPTLKQPRRTFSLPQNTQTKFVTSKPTSTKQRQSPTQVPTLQQPNKSSGNRHQHSAQQTLNQPTVQIQLAQATVKTIVGRCNFMNHNSTGNINVISTSLFGKFNDYVPTVQQVASEMRNSTVYKKWRLRVYHDRTLKQNVINNFLKSNSNIELCNIESLPFYGNVSGLHQSMWRFLAIGDPGIDVFASRDLDSTIMPRETAAVKEWLQSNRTTHIMRDHPSHGGEMLAGMWGFKNAKKRKLAAEIERLVLKHGMNKTLDPFWGDQHFLYRHVWQLVKDDVMMHDSYTCHKFEGSIPFPTQRINTTWIGCKTWHKDCLDPIASDRFCPQHCRPKGHQDWKYC